MYVIVRSDFGVGDFFVVMVRSGFVYLYSNNTTQALNCINLQGKIKD